MKQKSIASIAQSLNRSTPIHPGVPFKLNGETFLVPSLTLEEFEANYDVLTAPVSEVTKGALAERYNKCVGIIGLAIRANYPEVTDGDLRAWLRLSNFSKLLCVVQAASGMQEVDPGE